MTVQTILIAGANSHLAYYIRKLYAKTNNNVILLSRTKLVTCASRREDSIVCDALDKEALNKCLSNRLFDVVINCMSQQPRKETSFEEYIRGNVLTLDNLLSSLVLNNESIVIHFSSAAVYGAVKGKKLHEGIPANPQNNYALTKFMSEELLKCRSQEKKITSYCLRLPSLFGDFQEGGLIDTYYKTAKQGETLELYSRGKLIRNVMHFSEVAKVVERLSILTCNHLFNLYLIGSQNSLTMQKIAELIIDKLTSDSQIKLVDKNAAIAVDWDFDLSYSQKQLNFVGKTISESIDIFLQEKDNDNI